MAAAPSLYALTIAVLLALPGCAERPQESSAAAAAATPVPDAPVSSPATPSVAQHDRPEPTGPVSPSDCNAPKAERFIGSEAVSPIRAELAEAVAPISDIRWVGPGDATTEDLRYERLNVMLDVGGVIRSIHCG